MNALTAYRARQRAKARAAKPHKLMIRIQANITQVEESIREYSRMIVRLIERAGKESPWT